MLTKNDKKWISDNFGTKDWIIENFATKHDLNTEIGSLGERIEKKAKERHNELLDLFDGLAKEVKDNEEFRLVTNHRLDVIAGLAE
ncbi:MAG: hypothetical protein WAV56_02825 [Microgenomates group bacterium]